MRERNETALSQDDMSKLFKELKLTRIVCTISSLLAVFLLVWGGYLVYTIKGIVREAEPAIEKIAEVDVESLNTTLEHVNETLETVDLQPIVQAIEELDVEGFNAAIDSLDMEELSKALKNLNDAAEALKKLSQSLSPLTSFFN